MTDQSQRPTETEILEFIAQCDAFYPEGATDATIAQQRTWYDALCAAFSATAASVTWIDDVVGGQVPVRRYTPQVLRSDVHLLYIHGGGFVVGSLDSHHAICAEISEGVGARLTAVDYRLAPEHLWPAQIDDCDLVLKDLLSTGQQVVVIGDSAGGTLAAGLARRVAREGRAGLRGQALIYPGLGGDLGRGSYVSMAQAPGLSTADVRFYRDLLGAPEGDAEAQPLSAGEYAGLAPAYVTGAFFDPLHDDAADYAVALIRAGVEAWFRSEPQMIHSWLRARHMSPGAAEGFAVLIAAVRHLSGVR
ncbi:alpha/beta hydrolase [Pseudooceanicola spongiae]|uniref:Alpha/beta hydrolase fold domain-containing protein n=1 Tax=Pseudooceanicola spongiae TaxID=2613965 RepID=A0A7L9WKY1_9RHOB|nr:alpha/beta hydrolase [Pseudooceanicola spongiae]QOL80494.1 alpha/beta hydrolase fold domain-containing protein [Pseudooceanicola spongiae]